MQTEGGEKISRTEKLREDGQDFVKNFKPIDGNEPNPFRMCIRKQLATDSIMKCVIESLEVDGRKDASSKCRLYENTPEGEQFQVDVPSDSALNEYFSEDHPDKSDEFLGDELPTFPEATYSGEFTPFAHRCQNGNILQKNFGHNCLSRDGFYRFEPEFQGNEYVGGI